MKRILFVANVGKEHINKFHIPTIRAFKNGGWTVDVACSGSAQIPECDNRYEMCWKRSPFTFNTIKGIRQLQRLLNDNHYDIIYCHTPVGGFVCRLAARKARKSGTKVIYCAHGFHFFKGAPLINWLIYYNIEKWLAHFTDAIFTVNKEDYGIASRKFTNKTKVLFVPEVGVDFERLKVSDPERIRKEYRKELKIDDDTMLLVYVAELIPNKNQKMVIDAVKILLNNGEKVKLILPGPDHYNGAIEQYIHLLGLDDYVLTLGWRSDIGELLHASDICTATSIREGFGIILVEAMYCGLPVIATRNRGYEMLINDGENGYLVRPNDTVEFARKIKELIHNKELREKFTHNDVSMYDCNIIANQLYNIIIDLESYTNE